MSASIMVRVYHGFAVTEQTRPASPVPHAGVQEALFVPRTAVWPVEVYLLDRQLLRECEDSSVAPLYGLLYLREVIVV